MIERRYRRVIKALVKLDHNLGYIMFRVVSQGYDGKLLEVEKVYNKYRKEENK